MEGLGFKEASWDIREMEFNKDLIRVSTKDGPPT